MTHYNFNTVTNVILTGISLQHSLTHKWSRIKRFSITISIIKGIYSGFCVCFIPSFISISSSEGKKKEEFWHYKGGLWACERVLQWNVFLNGDKLGAKKTLSEKHHRWNKDWLRQVNWDITNILHTYICLFPAAIYAVTTYKVIQNEK